MTRICRCVAALELGEDEGRERSGHAAGDAVVAPGSRRVTAASSSLTKGSSVSRWGSIGFISFCRLRINSLRVSERRPGSAPTRFLRILGAQHVGQAPGECPDSVSPNSSISGIHHDYCQASTEWRNLAGASPRCATTDCLCPLTMTMQVTGCEPRWAHLPVAPPARRLRRQRSSNNGYHDARVSRCTRCRRWRRGRNRRPRRCAAALRPA